MKKIKGILDKSLFGVCSYLAQVIGIASSRVRLYFIYLTFATLGSPVLVYLFVAFWLNVKHYIKQNRNAIWS